MALVIQPRTMMIWVLIRRLINVAENTTNATGYQHLGRSMVSLTLLFGLSKLSSYSKISAAS